ncbi:GNAT family N-acetyltransferase [Streptomyces prunicolor]|uniref:GNAT family N-acetyltransferase n=1 Tax=Streptomyces prunicolor TaxID=67348 RepID=UPI00037C1E31|nr:GNAT family N-acetyltransferase [Streptomyces prunicolor]
MKITRATLDDVARLQQFRTDAAAWLAAQGSDQWSTPYPEDLLLNSVRAGEVFLFYAPETLNPVATVTLDTKADPVLWRAEEFREPALYVHKLTLAQPGNRSGLGRRILDWCGDRAARSGALWLRLDAWTSNSKLQAYYQTQGFTHVRTVYDVEAYGSGWVAQRPARTSDIALFAEPV